MSNDDVVAIQRAYPQIWFACHVRHRKRATSEEAPSDRDASILSHLDPNEPVRAGKLAQHLGIRPSTLSAALDELERNGFVTRRRSARDRRSVEVGLTERGRRAVSAGSPLDARRVAQLLAELRPHERAVAVHGMELLARAARTMKERR